jgi:peptidoglycan hydrolase-like protein with peptidoglycan-binding domain
MTSTITMFDADDDTQFPRGAQAYAGYVNGRIASQPNYQWIVAQFPHAFHLSITLNAGQDADALDVEAGAASVADVPGWYDRQRARGLARPCIYASASTMQTGIVPLIRSGRIPRASVRLWSAHYAGQHICSNTTCGAVSMPMDGTQWTPNAWGRNLDESLLVADFFAAPAPPKPTPAPAPPSVPAWQETMMNKLPVLTEGAEDKAGQVFFVHRLTALVKTYGEITGLPDVACQEIGGTFDAPTAANVRAVQAHASIAADGTVGPMTWGVLVTGAP